MINKYTHVYVAPLENKNCWGRSWEEASKTENMGMWEKTKQREPVGRGVRWKGPKKDELKTTTQPYTL